VEVSAYDYKRNESKILVKKSVLAKGLSFKYKCLA